MNNTQIRAFVRQLIAEAKDAKKTKKEEPKKTMKKEEKAPKSDGKLVDLKKELAALKQMKDELQVAKFAEKTAETEVEFANLKKFATELDKIKAGGVKLEQSIDEKIKELETKISDEKNKIKEMMGLTSKEKGKDKMMDETEFKGFQKSFVPKSEKAKKMPKTAIGGGGKNTEYSNSDVNYITDPYEKVSKQKK